jgi:hypothetical protein
MKTSIHSISPRVASSLEPLELRIAPAFGALLDLSALTGSNGFQINGEAAGDRSGFSVSDAGDVNGDGFDDLIIGADLADPSGSASGAIYIVFGRQTFSANFNLSTLNGINGFQINGEAAGDLAGRCVSAAGDINGDGFEDLIIGAPEADPNGTNSGAAYVIFGRATFSATFNLSSLNGVNGFRIDGERAGDHFGRSVSAAGDFNGDLFPDLIIGAPAADIHGSNSGAAYLIFGRATLFSREIEAGALTSTNGLRIDGEFTEDRAGRAVSGAGDVNGDNFSDVIIGAFRADPAGDESGAAYVVFGHADYVPVLELAALVGTNGFQMDGELAGDHAGRAVGGVVDINGDGFDDVIVGSPTADPHGRSAGLAHVVFGRGTAFPPVVSLAALNGANGFQINGEVAGDRAGHAVSNAGDVNGDNIEDIIIGAPFADPHGESSGASYVVYGKRSAFAAVLELSSLSGTNGFKIRGEVAGDQAGRDVSAAGDINGDGFGDLIVGAPFADPHGTTSGSSYVIFGQPTSTTPFSAASSSSALSAAAIEAPAHRLVHAAESVFDFSSALNPSAITNLAAIVASTMRYDHRAESDPTTALAERAARFLG